MGLPFVPGTVSNMAPESQIQTSEAFPERRLGFLRVNDVTEPTYIRARGLTKKFGSFVAVDGIDFEVRRGEAFGFLGPNGAGKSSTMRMVGCVSPITSGTLEILDMDPA